MLTGSSQVKPLIKKINESKSCLKITVPPLSLNLQLELCEAYAGGYYGGKSQQLAFLYIREMMASSRPVLWEHIFKLQRGMKHDMRCELHLVDNILL